MCGRAAQTSEVVVAASTFLRFIDENATHPTHTEDNFSSANKTIAVDHHGKATQILQQLSETNSNDNYNMSPGMDAFVFYYDKKSDEFKVDKKFWGLVTKTGTSTNPTPEGMGKHFEGLMFNARSDTLYEKPTFAKLANCGKTCLVALDGFFEWKAELGKGKKQPYFVYRKTTTQKTENGDTSMKAECHRPYLLMAGLWTSVPTGRSEDPILSTFTILTTEVCEPLKWLHSRMPVTVWDENLGLKWLTQPSASIHRQLEESAQQTPPNFFDWHAVSSDMSSMKFRSVDAIKPLPKVKTVKSFFAAASTNSNDCNSTKKESRGDESQKKRKLDTITPEKPIQKSALPANSDNKKPKCRTIQSFFKPK
jgi:putative SOS response-associated peptidase YedK